MERSGSMGNHSRSCSCSSPSSCSSSYATRAKFWRSSRTLAVNLQTAAVQRCHSCGDLDNCVDSGSCKHGHETFPLLLRRFAFSNQLQHVWRERHPHLIPQWFT